MTDPRKKLGHCRQCGCELGAMEARASVMDGTGMCNVCKGRPKHTPMSDYWHNCETWERHEVPLEQEDIARGVTAKGIETSGNYLRMFAVSDGKHPDYFVTIPLPCELVSKLGALLEAKPAIEPKHTREYKAGLQSGKSATSTCELLAAENENLRSRLATILRVARYADDETDWSKCELRGHLRFCGNQARAALKDYKACAALREKK